MELLAKLMALQEKHGALGDALLREVAREEGVPLYRLEGLRGFYPVLRKTPSAPTEVRVCRDIACALAGGMDFPERLRERLSADRGIAVEPVSCLGCCERAPAALIHDVPVSGDLETLAAYARGERALPEDTNGTPRRWPTDPYHAPGGRYGVLRHLLEQGREPAAAEAARDALIARLKGSGLRGMGGAGFPAGNKWDFTRRAAGAPKYVICNADESEPGTFKDRAILEDLPHLVLEAMAIGGWTIGANEGVIYLRHEYGRARRAIERALAEAERAGALGASLFGHDFAFRIRLFVSPGGYILGEETALLEALEDRRGEPRNKPPFPTTHGLWGKPTLINNVETFAAVPAILERGAEWWQAQGRRGGKGLKFMAVSGDVARPGVYCVPMGTSVAELIAEAGGMVGGRALAAFMPGGVSSNFLPASAAEAPLDFEGMQQAGSMLGSGALIVIGAGRDLLELAVNATRFFRNESCGKCVPCRVGSEKAVALLEEALAGRPREGLAAVLRELGETLQQTSICGLGQVALQPVLSALAHFPAAAARLNPNGSRRKR